MIRHNIKPYRSNSFIRMLAAMPCLLLLLVLGFAPTSASASQPNLPPAGNYTSIAAAPGGGFWVQLHTPGNVTDYRTLAIDGAPEYESVNEAGSIVAVPGTNGYWVVTVTGGIYARGAPELCSGHLSNCSGYHSNNGYITGAAASPNGQGLWAVDSARHLWTAGNVPALGDVTGDNRTPTGIAATPSGQGYYIVMDDGGVHARGDAVFYGSTGGNRPGGHDLVGIALSHDITGAVDGYWLVGSDGGVHTFGSATFLGSTGGAGRGAVSNIVTRPEGRSYAWVRADGQVGKSQDAPPITLKSITQGKVIDVPGGSMEPGTPLLLAAANGSASQKWKIVPPVPYVAGAMRLVNVNSGLCMDLEGNSVSGRVLQYTCKTPIQQWQNQLWMPVKAGNGEIQFKLFSHQDYRLYGYPDEYGAGLILSFHTNAGLDWNVTSAP
jgi:hypothetical protein